MSAVADCLAALSPEQRALYEARLRQRGGAPAPVAAPTPVAPVPVEAAPAAARTLDYSLFFFSDDAAAPSPEKYEQILAAARFADTHGLTAVWTPERHFHRFGGLYASPAVLGAAIAATTTRLQVRAGSVVLPLQHPARVAEEWAMIDNLSRGRVGVALASGWVPTDFVLAQDGYARRRETLLRRLDELRRLWRGESVGFVDPEGKTIEVATFPRPLQPELPLWLTTSGSRETWERAGELGVNVLTGLLQLSLEEVAALVPQYREARRRAGHAGPGVVSLMLHTFVGPDLASVRRAVKDPLTAYLRTHLDMYERMPQVKDGVTVDPSRFSADDRDALAEFAFQRYFERSGLFGTPATCLAMIDRLSAAGIDEVACLVDFGVPGEVVLEHLPYLAALRDADRARTLTHAHG